MYSIWLSFKENANWKGKTADVRGPGDVFEGRNHAGETENTRRSLIRRPKSMESASFRGGYSREVFDDLHMGDPSRSIVEKIWSSLKENANCKGKTTNVRGPSDVYEGRKHAGETKNTRSYLIRRPKSMESASFRGGYSREVFYDLNMGDPSRSIVEKIFRTASKKHSRRTREIVRVLRVNNSTDILGRFETYREMVKREANNQYMKLLRFYNTTMTCCSRKLRRVSELCVNSDCGVCRIIQTGFDNKETKHNGIQLSCEILSDDIVGVLDAKKAVVICRVIAGRVTGEVEEGFDSVASGRLSIKVENLSVRSPNAVLPCFVIIWV